MTQGIKPLVLGKLTPILANTWLIELPPNPQWPAAVFKIETNPEDGWVYGAGYDQHTISIVILGIDADEVGDITNAMRAALEDDDLYLRTESMGDGAYEPNPSVYGSYLTVTYRTRNF